MDAVRPLINEDLSVVFCDMATIRAEGLSEQADDIRQFGMSKEALIAHQFMLGLAQTTEPLRTFRCTPRSSRVTRPRSEP